MENVNWPQMVFVMVFKLLKFRKVYFYTRIKVNCVVNSRGRAASPYTPPTCASVCFYPCHCSGLRYCDRDADSQHDVLIFQHFRLSLHSQIRPVCFAPIFCCCLIRRLMQD